MLAFIYCWLVEEQTFNFRYLPNFFLLYFFSSLNLSSLNPTNIQKIVRRSLNLKSDKIPKLKTYTVKWKIKFFRWKTRKNAVDDVKLNSLGSDVLTLQEMENSRKGFQKPEWVSRSPVIWASVRNSGKLKKKKDTRRAKIIKEGEFHNK